ncbi:MAG: helix-turn-helix domain-containing protein [Candidatus Bathyarchaeota archaeon]|nr:MAG: helix-turn-helix domain-containing protein [Candidatus Bathyarchaeota archaeon]
MQQFVQVPEEKRLASGHEALNISEPDLPQDEPYRVTVQVVNTLCKGLRLLKRFDIRHYAMSDVRRSPGGLTRHLLELSSDDVARLLNTRGAKLRDSGENNGRASVWFDSDDCAACETILSQNSFLVSGRHVEGDTIIYSFVAPCFDALKNTIELLEAKGLDPRIMEVSRFTERRKPLTEKQDRILWLALKLGFFECPRKLTMADLSHRLGIGLSTLSEILRRGMRRLLERHYRSNSLRVHM